MTDLVQVEAQTALTIGSTQMEFTAQQLAALKQIGLQDAPEGDLMVFFHQCKRTGLDPFVRQIYMIPRWSSKGTRWTIQTGIDGFRLTAERSKVYAGSQEKWEFATDGTLYSATVVVYKMIEGQKCPFQATAHYAEYCQKNKEGNPSGTWATLPMTMLAKCAEAKALRKAFPQDLSGLYTAEEMAQAENVRSDVLPADTETGEIVEEKIPESKHFYRPVQKDNGAELRRLVEEAEAKRKIVEVKPVNPVAACIGRANHIGFTGDIVALVRKIGDYKPNDLITDEIYAWAAEQSDSAWGGAANELMGNSTDNDPAPITPAASAATLEAMRR